MGHTGYEGCGESAQREPLRTAAGPLGSPERCLTFLRFRANRHSAG